MFETWEDEEWEENRLVMESGWEGLMDSEQTEKVCVEEGEGGSL